MQRWALPSGRQSRAHQTVIRYTTCYQTKWLLQGSKPLTQEALCHCLSAVPPSKKPNSTNVRRQPANTYGRPAPCSSGSLLAVPAPSRHVTISTPCRAGAVHVSTPPPTVTAAPGPASILQQPHQSPAQFCPLSHHSQTRLWERAFHPSPHVLPFPPLLHSPKHPRLPPSVRAPLRLHSSVPIFATILLLLLPSSSSCSHHVHAPPQAAGQPAARPAPEHLADVHAGGLHAVVRGGLLLQRLLEALSCQAPARKSKRGGGCKDEYARREGAAKKGGGKAEEVVWERKDKRLTYLELPCPRHPTPSLALVTFPHSPSVLLQPRLLPASSFPLHPRGRPPAPRRTCCRAAPARVWTRRAAPPGRTARTAGRGSAGPSRRGAASCGSGC